MYSNLDGNTDTQSLPERVVAAMPPPVDIRSLLVDVYDNDIELLSLLQPLLVSGLDGLTRDLVNKCLDTLTQENVEFRVYATPKFLQILLDGPSEDPSVDIRLMYEYGNSKRPSTIARESEFRDLFSQDMRLLIADVLAYCYATINAEMQSDCDDWWVQEQIDEQSNILRFWRQGYSG